jgi:hypothetical protein
MLRVKVQFQDGTRGVLYAEGKEDLEDMKSRGILPLETTESSEAQMRVDQLAVLGGFTDQQHLATQGIPAALNFLLGQVVRAQAPVTAKCYSCGNEVTFSSMGTCPCCGSF